MKIIGIGVVGLVLVGVSACGGGNGGSSGGVAGLGGEGGEGLSAGGVGANLGEGGVAVGRGGAPSLEPSAGAGAAPESSGMGGAPEPSGLGGENPGPDVGDGGEPSALACGEGTTEVDGKCLPIIQCGAGTIPVGDRCVVDPTQACGPGTHFDAEQGNCLLDPTACADGTALVEGVCVPDGSVICFQGTKFDTATGTCVLDPTACADGTTLVGSQCWPDDDLLQQVADFLEGAEPNDLPDDNAGELVVPALNEATTFYGCITPSTDDNDELQADIDTWLLSANEPSVLEVTIDGIGGLSGGFIATSADAALSPLLDNWRRLAANLTGDTARRQIFLPAAGSYALDVVDGRTLLGLPDAPLGDDGSCYLATIKRLPMPTAIPLTQADTAGTSDGTVKVYRYTETLEGNIFDVVQSTDSVALLPAFVIFRNDVLVRSAVELRGSFGNTPPFAAQGGLEPGDEITLVTDAEHEYAVTPQSYVVQKQDFGVFALPTAGETITVTERNGLSSATYANLMWAYFDVESAGVKRFELSADKALMMAIVRRDVFQPNGAFDYVAAIELGSGRSAFSGELVRFAKPGRYYFFANNRAATAPGGTFALTSKISDVTTNPLTLGTPAVDVPLVAGFGLHALDLSDPSWLELGLTGTTNWAGSSGAIEAYDLLAEGWLRTGAAPQSPPQGSVYPLLSGAQSSSAPFTPLGRILVGETRDLLLRVRAVGPTDANPSYGLSVQTRPSLLLADLTGGTTTLELSAPGVTSTTPAYLLARAAPLTQVQLRAGPSQPDSDIRLVRVDANEASLETVNVTAAGSDETNFGLASAAPGAWVAWRIENATPANITAVDVTLNAWAQQVYASQSGALSFVDACAGGTQLGTALDDEIFTAQTLPPTFAAFRLFGHALPAAFRVSANGWLSWDTGTLSLSQNFNNADIPSANAPNALIAPFWQDLYQLTLCRKDDAVANTVTLQWTGNVYQVTVGQAVSFQVVLHASGSIDFVYGPNHESSGAAGNTAQSNGATVGLEGVDGTFGVKVGYNQAVASANTSLTFAPQ